MPPSPPDDPESLLPEEIQAEAILSKVDALLARHGKTRQGLASTSSADDDLPLLTEVCPAPSAPAAVPPAPSTRFPEALISLDSLLARELEAWFSRELPPLLERELARLAPRIQEAAIGHLHATLMPRLSEIISAHLDEMEELPVLQPEPPPHPPPRS